MIASRPVRTLIKLKGRCVEGEAAGHSGLGAEIIGLTAGPGPKEPKSGRLAGGKFISEIPKKCFSPDPNQFYIYRYPARHEGRFAIVTDVGRGAVDAAAAQDERR
jgi:hypothetical protein